MSESRDIQRLRSEYAGRAKRLAGSDIYSPFNPANSFIIQQRQRAMLKCLRGQGIYPLQEQCILELGCGSGGVLLENLSFGASSHKLHGAE